MPINNINEVKYKELDFENILLDPISYLPINNETCILINGRVYDRTTILHLMQSENKSDPFTKEPLNNLILDEDIGTNNDNYNYYVPYILFVVSIVLFIILIFIFSIFVLELKKEYKKINDFYYKVLNIGFFTFLIITCIIIFGFYLMHYINFYIYLLLIISVSILITIINNLAIN